jgi:NAD+ synthase
MCGGYSVLKDIYKTEVYALSAWRNAHRPAGARGPEGCVIPESSITKAPTAELRPNQTDQDSLPPYDMLDQILDAYVVRDLSRAEILGLGFDETVVKDVINKVTFSEYKRRQAAPGLPASIIKVCPAGVTQISAFPPSTSMT